MTSILLDQFLSRRGGSNSWAHRPELIDAWRSGSQSDVPPLTLEFAVLLECNASCPLCPYRRAQLSRCDGVIPIGHLAPTNDKTSASLDLAKRVLERSRDAGVTGSLFTGGGEPTIWPPLIDALRYSHDVGMANAIYTNGLALGYDPLLPSRLMQPDNGLVFIRISINATSPAAVRKHWGFGDPSVIERQFTGLRRLLRCRNRMAVEHGEARVPSIQISTIFDRHTVDDLDDICARVADAFAQVRTVRGEEDVMVVRPLTIHGRKRYSFHDHDDAVIRKALEICGHHVGASGRERLEQAGVELFLGFGLDRVESGDEVGYDDLVEHEYARRDISMSNGVFLTVGPDANVYASTEFNCGPDSQVIGNLLDESVADIYKGARRRRLLEHMNAQRWGPDVSQPTPRTARLDRIAGAIRHGELTDADIHQIRDLSASSHQLLLD